jgi:hypothetical protein
VAFPAEVTNLLITWQVVMEIGLVFKLLFFLLWPFLLMYIYYLTNKKKFMAQWEKLKQSGWFK